MLGADLHDLIAYISGLPSPPDGLTHSWRQWQIALIEGGRNGRVYRATSEQADLAVKLTARDRHDRAGREYCALQTLARAGLEIAPRPLLVERDRYRAPVVVMTWLAGTVSDDLPSSDDEWVRLVEHVAAIHRVTPSTTSIDLSEAVLSMRSPSDGLARVRLEVEQIPRADQPAALRRLLEAFERHDFPSWPTPPTSLRRGDPNIRNIVRRPGAWASVDWEYSGWSDPAAEIADLIAHAAYLDVPAERWAWVTQVYASLGHDPGVIGRIDVYTSLMYGFWAGRLGRMLYQVPRGLDDRLAPWPDGWLDSVRRNYERYLELAARALR